MAFSEPVFFPFHQSNVDEEKTEDDSSAGCALYASQAVASWLARGEMYENLRRQPLNTMWLRQHLLLAVRKWDLRRQGNGADIAGELPALVEAESAGPVDMEALTAANQQELQSIFQKLSADSRFAHGGIVATSLSPSSTPRHGQTANSFGILWDALGVVIVDSHAHGSRGMMVHNLQRLSDAAAWISDCGWWKGQVELLLVRQKEEQPSREEPVNTMDMDSSLCAAENLCSRTPCVERTKLEIKEMPDGDHRIDLSDLLEVTQSPAGVAAAASPTLTLPNQNTDPMHGELPSVISKQTAARYRRELSQGFYEKYVGHGEDQKQYPLSVRAAENRRKSLEMYTQRLTRRGAVKREIQKSAETNDTNATETVLKADRVQQDVSKAMKLLARALGHTGDIEMLAMEMRDGAGRAMDMAVEALDSEDDEPNQQDTPTSTQLCVAAPPQLDLAGSSTCQEALRSGKRKGEKCGRSRCKFHRG